MRVLAPLAGALILAAPAPSPAAAGRWEVAIETPASGGADVEVAVVTNESGHSLRVYRNAAGVVQAVFSIRGGFDTLSDALCPTYQIDEHPPVAPGGEDCGLEAKSARFPLGTVNAGVVRSDALLALMNGSRIAFRYRMPSLGYRETSFSLRGSKQSLNRAIGTEVVVLEE